MERVVPNAAGDWINQRSELFDTFPPLGDKQSRKGTAIFDTYSLGVLTGRDSWAFNFSSDRLLANVRTTINFYNSERERFAIATQDSQSSVTTKTIDDFVDADSTRISWTVNLKQDILRNRSAELSPEKVTPSMYRPFCKEWLYFDRQWNERVLLMPSLFPTPAQENRVIAVSGVGAGTGYSVLMTDVVPACHLVGAGNAVQCFPRYRYVEAADQSSLFRNDSGYERHDAISQRSLDTYRDRFGDHVTSDDVFYYVYGVLHSPEYRNRFEADLGKMIPRLPMLAGFAEFAASGRRLAELHLGYETIEPWPLDGLPGRGAKPKELRVEKMSFGGIARTPDRSVVVVNQWISLSGVPEEAHRYEVNGRTALEWIIDRYQVKIDKASGIQNDPSDWSDDPHYIVDLVARIVRVSIKSAAIIDQLPPLGI